MTTCLEESDYNIFVSSVRTIHNQRKQLNAWSVLIYSPPIAFEADIKTL